MKRNILSSRLILQQYSSNNLQYIKLTYKQQHLLVAFPGTPCVSMTSQNKSSEMLTFLYATVLNLTIRYDHDTCIRAMVSTFLYNLRVPVCKGIIKKWQILNHLTLQHILYLYQCRALNDASTLTQSVNELLKCCTGHDALLTSCGGSVEDAVSEPGRFSSGPTLVDSWLTVAGCGLPKRDSQLGMLTWIQYSENENHVLVGQ